MYYKIFNDKKEEIREEKNNEEATKELTKLLFNKYIVKYKYIKQVQYQYNYSDKQVITFVFENKYRQVFYDVPTKMRSIRHLDYIIAYIIERGARANRLYYTTSKLKG